MKITKEQLTQIIKEEIAEVLNEMPYRGPGYRYTKKGMATAALKRQQIKRSNEMREKGKADALAGNPKDNSIQHLVYGEAYDEAMKDIAKLAGMNFFNYDSLGQGEEPEKDYEFWQTNYEGKYLDSFEDGEREAALNHEDAMYDLGL